MALYPFFALNHGSPQKIFEYLGMGIPTIAPKVPVVQEVFEDGVHCLMAEQDGSNLIELIEKVKADRGYSSKVAKVGQRFVLDNYTWDQNAKRLLDHMQHFVKGCCFHRLARESM